MEERRCVAPLLLTIYKQFSHCIVDLNDDTTVFAKEAIK